MSQGRQSLGDVVNGTAYPIFVWWRLVFVLLSLPSSVLFSVPSSCLMFSLSSCHQHMLGGRRTDIYTKDEEIDSLTDSQKTND